MLRTLARRWRSLPSIALPINWRQPTCGNYTQNRLMCFSSLQVTLLNGGSPTVSRSLSTLQNKQKPSQKSSSTHQKSGDENCDIVFGLGRMKNPRDFLEAVKTHILRPSAQPMPVMIERALKNLVAPDLLSLRPRVKANLSQKIFAKALRLQLDLPVTVYDFYLRLQCQLPSPNHDVPVHELKKLLEKRNVEPDDVLLFTLMRGFALCGDVVNTEFCFKNCYHVNDEHYAQLVMAHAVNGDACGILDSINAARDDNRISNFGTLIVTALHHLARIGSTQDVELVLEMVESLNVRIRLSMLDSYLRLLAVNGDFPGISKLQEWKSSVFENMAPAFEVEAQLLNDVVFGSMDKTLDILNQLQSHSNTPFKSITTCMDILAVREDMTRLETFYALLLEHTSFFKSNAALQDSLAQNISYLGNFKLAFRILLKTRTRFPHTYASFKACFHTLAKDNTIESLQKENYLRQLVKWADVAGHGYSKECLSDILKVSATLTGAHLVSIKPMFEEVRNISHVVDSGTWHSLLRACKTDSNLIHQTQEKMEDAGIHSLQLTYQTLMQSYLEANDIEKAKLLAVDAVESTRSCTRTTTIFAPVLRQIVQQKGSNAGLNYLREIIQLSERMGLRLTCDLIGAWCDGSATTEGLQECLELLKDMELSPPTFARILRLMTLSGSISEALNVASEMKPGQFSSTSVDILLESAILKDGSINEETLRAVASLHQSKGFSILDGNWTNFFAACPSNTAKNQQELITLCSMAFGEKDWESYLLATPIQQANVDDIVSILANSTLEQSRKRKMAIHALERVSIENPHRALELLEELAADNIIIHEEGAVLLAHQFFGQNFLGLIADSSHREAIVGLVRLIVDYDLVSNVPPPSALFVKTMLSHAQPREAAVIVKFALKFLNVPGTTESLCDGLTELLGKSQEIRLRFGEELDVASVDLPLQLAELIATRVPSASGILFPYLPRKLQSRHIAHEAASSSKSIVGEYLSSFPEELGNVLSWYAKVCFKRQDDIVTAVTKFLQEGRISFTEEAVNSVITALRGLPSDRMAALAVLQTAGAKLSEEQRYQLEALTRHERMLAGDSDAVASFLEEHTRTGTTLPLKEYSKIIRSRFKDADFILSMLHQTDKICPHPWEDSESVEKIIFAMSYHRQHAGCLAKMKELLEIYFPLTGSLTKSQLQLYICLYTCTDQPEALLKVFKRLKNPAERTYIDTIRCLRKNDRISEALTVFDEYIRSNITKNRVQMLLREMAPFLDVDACNFIIRVCADTKTVVPPAIIRCHFMSLFKDNSARCATDQLYKYKRFSGANLDFRVVVDLFIDAALETKQFHAVVDCIEQYPDVCEESHIVACSKRALRFHQHRIVELMAQVAVNRNLSRETFEAVMLDRMRAYSQFGQLNDVVETLWADSLSHGKPSNKFLADAIDIWEKDQHADITRLHAVLKEYFPLDTTGNSINVKY